MAAGREQADTALLDRSIRFNAMVLNSDINRDLKPLDYAIRVRSNDHDEPNDTGSGAIGEDWVDDAPLETIKNDYKIDLEILSLRRREPREDNRKRKLCYSPFLDDGYYLSKRVYQQLRRRKRVIRGRGKRFRPDDSMVIDDESTVVSPGEPTTDCKDCKDCKDTGTTSQNSDSINCLSDGEMSGSYVSDEGTVRDEEEIDEEEEMEANLPEELLIKMESKLSFSE